MDSPAVSSLFRQQLGVAETSQLVEAGVSARTIRRARHEGRIVVVVPGVFCNPGAALTFELKSMALLLHCGTASFLSGSTAAAHYGFRSMPKDRITMTVPATSRVSALPAWARIHRSAWTDQHDIRTLANGLRVSSPLLTLFNLASEFNQFRFHRAAEDAWHLGLVTPNEAACYLDVIRRSGRGGVAVFEAWLETVRGRKRPSQSGLELDLVDVIRGIGLPEPQRQHPVRLLSGEVIHLDLAWPAIKLGVEPGHSWWHGGDLGVRRDQARFNACGEVGWHVVPLDESMKDDLAGVGRLIKNIYDARCGPPAAS